MKHRDRPDCVLNHSDRPPASSPLALLATLREHFEQTLSTTAADPTRDLWPARLALANIDALTALVESQHDAPDAPDDVEDLGDADSLCLTAGCTRPAAGIRYGAHGIIDYRSSSLCFCPEHASALWAEYEHGTGEHPARRQQQTPTRPRHTRRPKDARMPAETDPRDPRD